MVDFGEIVIFGREPEDGDRRNSGAVQLLRAVQGRGCFEERVQRSAEESDLLAGDDGDGAFAESPESFLSLLTHAEGGVLPLKNVGYAGTAPGIVLNQFRLVGQPASIRRAGVELGNILEMKKVIEKEPGGMRNGRVGNAARAHRELRWQSGMGQQQPEMGLLRITTHVG